MNPLFSTSQVGESLKNTPKLKKKSGVQTAPHLPVSFPSPPPTCASPFHAGSACACVIPRIRVTAVVPIADVHTRSFLYVLS